MEGEMVVVEVEQEEVVVMALEAMKAAAEVVTALGERVVVKAIVASRRSMPAMKAIPNVS